MFPKGNDFESEFTFENAAVPLPEKPPFHILLLGDWSGRSTGKKDLNERRPVVVDRDNFDEVLKSINVGLDLDWQGEVLPLQFAELDDFHPDNLFQQVTLFSELRDIRRRLLNPDTFNKAANEVRAWFYTDAVNNNAVNQTGINDSPPVDSSNLLDMILTKPNESSSSAKTQLSDNSELGRFVSKIVSPFKIQIDESEQSNLIAAVDETISELMRTILHHPKFQNLESAWRGLYFLVKRIDTDVDLKIFILDISKTELIGNLKESNSLTDSFLYRQLVTLPLDIQGGESFAVVGGNYSFNINVDDIASLMRIGKIASAANSPFLSYVQPEIFGLQDFSEKAETLQLKVLDDSDEVKLWTALRSSPEANYIGLSPMKILARNPFGNLTDAIETFSFEEFTETRQHKNYLWINPCFVLILLLAQSYRHFDWEMGHNLKSKVENLPMPLFQEDGETKAKPCAEVVLTESMVDAILDQGMMPLISFLNTDYVLLGRFQSISILQPKLNGKWNQ